MGTDGDLFFSYALPKDSHEDYCCYAAFTKIRTIVQKNPMIVKVERCKLLTARGIGIISLNFAHFVSTKIYI